MSTVEYSLIGTSRTLAPTQSSSRQLSTTSQQCDTVCVQLLVVCYPLTLCMCKSHLSLWGSPMRANRFAPSHPATLLRQGYLAVKRSAFNWWKNAYGRILVRLSVMIAFFCMCPNNGDCLYSRAWNVEPTANCPPRRCSGMGRRRSVESP
jgi:hypothetical protein